MVDIPRSKEELAKEMNVSLTVADIQNGFYQWDQYGPPTLNQALISHLAWTWQTYQYDHAKGLKTPESAKYFFMMNCVGALQLLLKFEKVPPQIDAHNAVSAMHVIAADIGKKVTKATAARHIRSYAVQFIDLVRTNEALKESIGITNAYKIVFESIDRHCRGLAGAKSWTTVKHWDMRKNSPDTASSIEDVNPVPVIIENENHFRAYVDRMIYLLGLIYAHLADRNG